MKNSSRFKYDKHVLIIALASTMATMMLALAYEAQQIKETALLKAQSRIEQQKEIFSQQLQYVAKDLRYLAGNRLLQQYLLKSSNSAKEALEQELRHFAQIKGLYDQVRYLDSSGKEIIRVNYNLLNNFATIVPRDHLQDKSDRYYFKNAIQLASNEMYLSPLDLNVEKGAVETPYKPVIRAAKRVIDDNGKPRGIIILNFLAKGMLESVRSGTEGLIGSFAIINSGGYWLIAPDQKDEWGFMFDGGQHRTFARRYPDLWQQILTKESGMLTGSEGSFYHTTYLPINRVQFAFATPATRSVLLEKMIQSGESRWHLVYHIGFGQLLDALTDKILRQWHIHLLLFLILVANIYMLFHIRKKRQERIRNLRIIGEVYASSNEGILITDEKARILKVNDAFTRITGYSEAEMLGSTPAKIASGWTDKKLYERMWGALDENGYWEGEVWDRRKDGSLYSEWLRITAVRDEKGSVCQSEGHCH